MTPDSPAPEEEEEAIGRLADDLARPDADVAGVGPEGVDPRDVERCLRAARALHDALRLDDVAADAPPEPPLRLPTDYEVLGEVGRGGMGVVYRARQRSLDRIVAVKVLRRETAFFRSALARFLREVRTLAKLRHPHIVAIHEVGETDGSVHYAMDLIEGRSLAERLKEGPLSPAEASRLVRQVASAIAYVHAHGLVHRDLKPANIVLDAAGDAFVTDFGLALDTARDDGLTLSGQVVGTPGYMSPEQARGDGAAVGEATDVHALGVLLYECLTGRRPFRAASPADEIYAVIHDAPVPPRRHDRRIPADLQSISLKALEKDPAHRYATASALLEDLERFEAGLPVLAQPPSRWRAAGRFVRRNRGVLVAAAAACGAVVAAYTLVLSPRARRDDLLSVADDLVRRGEAGGAAVVFERAAREGGLEGDDRRAFVESRVTQVRRMREAGEVEGTVDLLRRSIDLVPPDDEELRARLRWELGTSVDRLGRTQEAAEERAAAVQMLDRWLNRRRLHEFGAFRFQANPRIRLGWIDDVSLDPEHPRHADAISELRAIATEPENPASEAFTSWILAVPERAPAKLRGVLRAAFEPVDAGRAVSVDRGLWTAVRSAPREPTVRVLEDAAADPRESLAMRRAAASFLVSLVDLAAPDGGRWILEGDRWVRVAEFDPERVVAAWRSVRDLPRLEAYRRRVSLALLEWERSEAEPLSALDRQADAFATWFRRHTGYARVGAREAGRVSAARSWFDRHGDEDPRLWLATALDLGDRPEDLEFAKVRERLLYPGADVGLLHSLLVLLAPEGVVPPAWRRGEPDRTLAVEWLRVPVGAADRWRVHVVRACFEDGRWTLDPSTAATIEATTDEPFRVEVPIATRLLTGPFVAVGVPGILVPRLPPTLSVQSIEASVTPSEAGPFLGTGGRAAPGFSSWGSRHDVVRPGIVGMLEPEVGRWSSGGPASSRSIVLARLAPTGDAPADLDDWRRAYAEGVELFAREVRDACAGETDSWTHWCRHLGTRQREVLAVAALGARIDVPPALAGLRELHTAVFDATDRLDPQSGLLELARLMAGDETLLERSAFLERLDALESDGIVFNSADREAYWVRLLATTPSPRIRDLAVERLRKRPMDAEAAGALLDAVRAGRAQVPEALADRLAAGPTDDRSLAGRARRHWGWSLLVVLGWALAGVGLARTARTWRSPSAVLVPASLLVGAGFLFLGVHAALAGRDLLPDVVGYALAAVGAVAITRATHIRAGWIAAVAFALAAAMEAAREAIASPHWTTAGGLVAATGVVSIFLLAIGLRRLAERERPAGGWSGRVRVAWLVAAFVAVFTSVALLLRLSLPASVVLVIAATALGAVLGALLLGEMVWSVPLSLIAYAGVSALVYGLWALGLLGWTGAGITVRDEAALAIVFALNLAVVVAWLRLTSAALRLRRARAG